MVDMRTPINENLKDVKFKSNYNSPIQKTYIGHIFYSQIKGIDDITKSIATNKL